MKIQLLCTFATDKTCEGMVESIRGTYTLSDKRFFVFQDVKSEKDIFLTYNVMIHDRFEKIPYTISIHRKKQTNTLYSLNALNILITEENGELDKSYVLDWKLYENSLVISGDVSVRIIALKLFNILELR